MIPEIQEVNHNLLCHKLELWAQYTIYEEYNNASTFISVFWKNRSQIGVLSCKFADELQKSLCFQCDKLETTFQHFSALMFQSSALIATLLRQRRLSIKHPFSCVRFLDSQCLLLTGNQIPTCLLVVSLGPWIISPHQLCFVGWSEIL